jgi:hypothetical protein
MIGLPGSCPPPSPPSFTPSRINVRQLECCLSVSGTPWKTAVLGGMIGLKPYTLFLQFPSEFACGSRWPLQPRANGASTRLHVADCSRATAVGRVPEWLSDTGRWG